MYDFVKDFQTLIAALVALAAAVIAYTSAQRVAKRQIAVNKEAEFKRELSLTAALMEWSNTLDLIAAERYLECKIIVDTATVWKAATVKLDDSPGSLPRIRDAKLLTNELSLSTINWQDVAIVSIDAQSIYHRIVFCIQVSDRELLDTQKSFTLNNSVTVSQIQRLQDCYTRVSEEAKKGYDGFERILKTYSPRYREMMKRET